MPAATADVDRLLPPALAARASAAVRLESITKTFPDRAGTLTAVCGVDLEIDQGTLTSLLGPSGCGKTTLLRIIAGLEQPTKGRVVINGADVGDTPIHRRNIGLVFQNYALFPHKTVGENIAFGLKHRGADRVTTDAAVRRALDMVRLPDLHARLPNQLSGGQQQRVALARAVVFEPDVLLLDEPLSALDANLREQMRLEIKRIQKELRLTTILVTHDQEEALSMSDQIVVMNAGKVQQVDSPAGVYRRPRNRFVARFLGQANTLAGRAVDVMPGERAALVQLGNGMTVCGVVQDGGQAIEQGRPVDVVIRAEDVRLSPPRLNGAATRNQYPGRIEDMSYLGDSVLYVVDVADLKLRATSRVDAQDPQAALSVGTEVSVTLPVGNCSILSGEGTQ